MKFKNLLLAFLVLFPTLASAIKFEDLDPKAVELYLKAKAGDDDAAEKFMDLDYEVCSEVSSFFNGINVGEIRITHDPVAAARERRALVARLTAEALARGVLTGTFKAVLGQVFGS